MENIKEQGFAKVRELYGEEAEATLRKYIGIVGPEFYIWMADLYVGRDCKCENFDKDGNRICLLPRDENGRCLCHGGGFYYSNSARDNDEFDIDIESTVQALYFLRQSGLISSDKTLKEMLPPQMQKDVIAFAKSLQDPEDGYFYHPQWGKNIIPSRQGRDLGWSTSIISSLGDMPLYDTKNGHKGSLGAPSGVKPQETEENTEEKNQTWAAHLQTLDAFKEYIGSFNLKTQSYPFGNNVNAQNSQFKMRDKQGVEDGEFTELRPDGYPVGGFVETLEKTLNSQQNPKNGLWTDDVCYSGVNGLMKLSTSYNAMGLKINYPEEAFESALKIILLPVDTPDVQGKLPGGSVDTYNPWTCVNAILSNVKKFGTEEQYNKLRAKLKENIVELIKCSGEKAMKFKKADGSFGYTWTVSPARSQAAPVSVPDTVEGDINGGTIATFGIFGVMCSALGVTIPFFTPDDYEIFIDRIKKKCGYK